MISTGCVLISPLILFHSDFTSIMTENNKPINLLKELRDEIGTAMSVYSAEEDKEKQERMVSIFNFYFYFFFVWGFPLENFSLKWRRHLCR